MTGEPPSWSESPTKGSRPSNATCRRVICVTEGVAPELFPNRQQMEEAATKPLDEVGCAQLSDDATQFGAQGSPTMGQ